MHVDTLDPSFPCQWYRCPSPCQCYGYLRLYLSYPDYRFSKVYLNNLYLSNPGDRNKYICLCSNFHHSDIVEDTLKKKKPTTTTTINQGHINKFQQCLSLDSANQTSCCRFNPLIKMQLSYEATGAGSESNTLLFIYMKQINGMIDIHTLHFSRQLARFINCVDDCEERYSQHYNLSFILPVNSYDTYMIRYHVSCHECK